MENQSSVNDHISQTDVEARLLASGDDKRPPRPKTAVRRGLQHRTLTTGGDGERNCFITGAVFLTDGRIVIVDNVNCKLMVHASSNLESISKIDTEHRPWDVILIANNEVAVSLPDVRRIYIYAITDKNDINKRRELHLEEPCYGMCLAGEKLFVCCDGDPSSVKILDRHGRHKKSLSLDVGSLPLSEPGYVAVHPDTGRIFVSARSGGYMKCITVDGYAVWEKRLTSAGGLQVADDHVLLAVPADHTVRLLTLDGDHRKNVVSQRDGSSGPQTICINSDGGKLLVTDSTNVIRIFAMENGLFS